MKTIEPKFWINDQVKIMSSEIVGLVNIVSFNDIEAKKFKYWVEYVTKEGEVKGNWFDEYQLSK